jgi:hypothetical protein
MEAGKLMKLGSDRATIKGLYFCFDALSYYKQQGMPIHLKTPRFLFLCFQCKRTLP